MSQIESKDILINIFSMCGDGIACIDLSGNILFANKSFVELLGYTSDEIKEKNIYQLLIGEKSFNKLIMNNESGEKFCDKKFIKKLGEEITLQVKLWRQQNGLSDATIWLILKNIKENKKIELSPGINPNGNHLSKVTLDLQEQLKIISNCLKNLRQDFGCEIEDVDDYISFASEACIKAKTLLNDLLECPGTNFINKDLSLIFKEQIEILKQVN